MCVSLQEVLEGAGYNVVNDPNDAEWFLGQRNDFEKLYERAETLVEENEEMEEDE